MIMGWLGGIFGWPRCGGGPDVGTLTYWRRRESPLADLGLRPTSHSLSDTVQLPRSRMTKRGSDSTAPRVGSTVLEIPSLVGAKTGNMPTRPRTLGGEREGVPEPARKLDSKPPDDAVGAGAVHKAAHPTRAPRLVLTNIIEYVDGSFSIQPRTLCQPSNGIPLDQDSHHEYKL
ncbi:hypothetical protein LX36DRAFT_663955 [Colletotrichum falcatum]|nr:hypothetical protein LX36DRAFT_663955 [Colletotrichum falcatum]